MNAPEAIRPYAARRAQVLAAMGRGVAVLATSPGRVVNRDTHHAFRFDGCF